MKFNTLILMIILVFSQSANSTENANASLADLKNYQVNTAHMVSSGLPTKQHFKTLKAMGVTTVIDLIPGDRTEELNLMKSLDLRYYNIGVEWENPTIENFKQYVLFMQQSNGEDAKTLTHCRLNWRGAVFTYLYRVTQLKESEPVAKEDMLEIWQPNDVWQTFIDDVKAQSQ